MVSDWEKLISKCKLIRARLNGVGIEGAPFGPEDEGFLLSEKLFSKDARSVFTGRRIGIGDIRLEEGEFERRP